MRIENLRLRGFIGIKKGMGLDEVIVDLSALSGLVALAGPNGHGKTTILDNLHPFRQLASRKKSLNHHVRLRDSEKELSFEYNGDFFKTLLKVDAESDRSEGFIWRNGKSEIDGKVSNYDRYVTELLGSPSLFFNSVFCAQNADKLSDMTTGDVKKLFSEFLRLDRLVAWENTCKQCISVISGNEDRLTREIDQLNREIESKAGSAEAIQRGKKKISDIEDGLRVAKKSLEKLKAEESRLHELASKHNVATEQLKALNENAKKIESVIASTKRQMAEEINKLASNDSKALAQIADLTKLVGKGDSIRAAAEDVAKLDTEIDGRFEAIRELESEQERINSELSSARERYRVIAGEIKELTGIDKEKYDLEAELKLCRGRVADLCKKDPDCKSRTCSFISGALEAERRIPELGKKLAERVAAISGQLAEKQPKLADAERAGKELKDKADKISAQLKELRTAFNNLREQCSEKKKLAASLPELQAAQATIDALNRQMVENDERMKTVEAQYDERIASLEKEKAEYFSRADELSSDLAPGTSLKLENICTDIAQSERGINSATDGLSSERANMVRLEADLKQHAELTAKRNDLSEKKQRLSGETSEWIYLRNACGKDGLRALEIDSVAPVISGYANDLLHGTFGPNYSVKFQTQDPESGREVLDILAIREDGAEVLLDNLSGGEKVWSLKALRLAMTLITQERSGRHYDTLFADEEDGALSEENAVSFIQLYRALMGIAGMSTCFYISHKPECVAMADHVIQFGRGGVTIQ